MANALGVAVVGAVYFGVETAHSQRVAVIAAVITLGTALALCAIGLEWLRRTTSPAEARRLDPPALPDGQRTCGRVGTSL